MGCGASAESDPSGSPNRTNNSGTNGNQEPRDSNTALRKEKTSKIEEAHDTKSPSVSNTKCESKTATTDPIQVPQNKVDNSNIAHSSAKGGNSQLEMQKSTNIQPNNDNSKTSTSESVTKSDSKTTEADILIEEPKDQRSFDLVLKSACMMLKPECLFKLVTKDVRKLQLRRALPPHFSLPDLLSRFHHLQDLDISNNNMGPQCFRAVCLAMCGNSTVLSLNLAGNRSDTDSADSVGRMLQENKTLQYLDVSSNNLGKDYFSRRVGEALNTNTALKTLRAESVGTTDAPVFMDGLRGNTSLTELDFSSNDVTDKLGFGKGLAECLQNANCSLTSIALGQCRLNAGGIREIERGLSHNHTVTELNLVGSEFGCLGDWLSFTITAAKHPCMRNLSLDRSQVLSSEINTGWYGTCCRHIMLLALWCGLVLLCIVSFAF